MVIRDGAQLMTRLRFVLLYETRAHLSCKLCIDSVPRVFNGNTSHMLPHFTEEPLPQQRCGNRLSWWPRTSAQASRGRWRSALEST